MPGKSGRMGEETLEKMPLNRGGGGGEHQGDCGEEPVRPRKSESRGSEPGTPGSA